MMLGTEPCSCVLGDGECTTRTEVTGPAGGTEILPDPKGSMPLMAVKDLTIIEGEHLSGGRGCRAFAHVRASSCLRSTCTCSSWTRKSKRSTRRCCVRVASVIWHT